MAIIHYAVCGINAWKLGSTLNYFNIMQPVYFSVFLHDNFFLCGNYKQIIIIFLLIEFFKAMINCVYHHFICIQGNADQYCLMFFAFWYKSNFKILYYYKLTQSPNGEPIRSKTHWVINCGKRNQRLKNKRIINPEQENYLFFI